MSAMADDNLVPVKYIELGGSTKASELIRTIEADATIALPLM